MQDSYEPNKEIVRPPEIIPDTKQEESQGQIALDELSRILDMMGIRSQVFYQEKPDCIHLEIHGPNLGLVIGKHGQTLGALEFIMNVIHRKKYPDAKPLILDAQGYREKKKGLLKRILDEASDHALRTQRDVELDPMPSYDRKVIHLMSKNLDGIMTESHGEGVNRRVIIKIDDNNDSQKHEAFVN